MSDILKLEYLVHIEQLPLSSQKICSIAATNPDSNCMVSHIIIENIFNEFILASEFQN